jgi:tripartite ATP-independent transporter DctP family solute receptor
LKVFDLPYLFEGVTHFKNVVRGPVGQYIASEIEGNGVVMLAYLLPGVRSIFNNVRPIQSLEDAKAMKIRTMESPVYLETLKSLGMLPTPMPSSELYTSLQTGVVDAGENDPASVVSWGWIDVIKFYSLEEHSISCMAVIMNKQRFQSFPPDIQKAIKDAAREAETYQLDYIEKAWADSLKKIQAKGVKINKIENKQPFQDAVRYIVDKYDKEIGHNLVQMVRDTPKK